MLNCFKRYKHIFKVQVFMILLASSRSGMRSVFPNSGTSCAFCSGRRRITSGRSCGATPRHETRWKTLWRTSVRLAETSCFLYLRNEKRRRKRTKYATYYCLNPKSVWKNPLRHERVVNEREMQWERARERGVACV